MYPVVAIVRSDTDCWCVARAKTGSGKTAAYVLPVLQVILNKKAVCFFPL